MPQTNEWLLYRASGQLPRGFQGHISYTTLLPGELRALRVVFTFDKREPQQEPDTLRAGCMAAAAQNLPEGTPVPEALVEHLCTMPKGEINVSLFLNGACVGSAHRNQLLSAFPNPSCKGANSTCKKGSSRFQSLRQL